MTWFSESLRWYGTLAVASWGFAPLVRLLCPGLADRGATVARPLALLGVIYPLWLLASLDLVPYATVGLWVTLGVAAVAGWGIAFRSGLITRDWLRALLVAEVIFLAAFVFYVWLRGFTPRITGTEKPMDVAFLASSARTTEMPPPDPWYAGETINYYYLGYFLHGSLARLANVPVWTAFNLALATTFAMTISAAAGLAFNAARSALGRRAALAAAALAAFLLPVAGNLYAPIKFLQDPRATLDGDWWGVIGWRSSRVVIDDGSPLPETINEFPYFSFLLGDFHPHVAALPFTLVALTLTLNLLRGGWTDGGRSWATLAVSGAAIGALYPLNSWDFPTYLGLAVAAVLVAGGVSWAATMRATVLVGAAVVAWLPFFVTFVPFAGGSGADLPTALRDVPVVSRLLTTVGFYLDERTAAGEFLTVFGLPWLAAVVFLGVELGRSLRAEPAKRVPGPAVVAAALVGLLAIALPAPVLILAGAPLAVASWLLWRNRERVADARSVATALFAVGCGLILGTEFFYIQDVFNGRFNTLFKVYYQVWSLFAIGTALAVTILWRETAHRSASRALLTTGLSLAIVAGLVYPVVASEQWTEWPGPRDWQGLDGAAFIEDHAPGDLAAIEWLAEHAEEDDVVLEAPGCQYRINFGFPTSRLSAFTGVPTVIGWGGSENQWRGGQPELHGRIGPRAEDVAAMYADPQSPLFERYGVTLLYVGHFERQGAPGECDMAGPYPEVDEPSYPGPGWTEVFASGEARIYQREGAQARGERPTGGSANCVNYEFAPYSSIEISSRRFRC